MKYKVFYIEPYGFDKEIELKGLIKSGWAILRADKNIVTISNSRTHKFEKSKRYGKFYILKNNSN